MGYYAGLDVSLKSTHVCVIDDEGAIAWQGQCDSHPGQIAHALKRWHGEGHSLMRAYEKTGGKLPENMTMFVDRISCANCRTHLPKLTQEMGIKNLTLNFKNGRRGRISDGKFEWLD